MNGQLDKEQKSKLQYQRQIIKLQQAVICLLLIAIATGGYIWHNEALNKNAKIKLTEAAAKKDSIRAKQSDIRVANLTHPVAVYVDSAKDITWLAIRNNMLSHTELPDMSPPADTVISPNTPGSKKPDDSEQSYTVLIAYLKKRIDSLIDDNATMKVSLHLAKVREDKRHLDDSVAAIPIKVLPVPNTGMFVIGGKQTEANRVPDFSLKTRVAANYSFTRDVFSTGLGVEAGYKNNYLNLMLYKDVYPPPVSSKFRFVIGYNKDLFRLISSKRKNK